MSQSLSLCHSLFLLVHLPHLLHKPSVSSKFPHIWPTPRRYRFLPFLLLTVPMAITLPIPLSPSLASADSPNTSQTPVSPNDLVQTLTLPVPNQSSTPSPTNALTSPLSLNILQAKHKPSWCANTTEQCATHNAIEHQRCETLNGRFLVCYLQFRIPKFKHFSFILDGLAYLGHLGPRFRFMLPTLIHEVPHGINKSICSDIILRLSGWWSITNEYWYIYLILNMAEGWFVCEDFYAKHSKQPHISASRSQDKIALGHELWSTPSGASICEGLGAFNLVQTVCGPHTPWQHFSGSFLGPSRSAGRIL